MYANVIVGVDGRSGGEDAEVLANDLVGSNGQIVLAQVRRTDAIPDHGVKAGFEHIEGELWEDLIEHEQGTLPKRPEIVSVVAASVGEGLRKVADRRGGDLIVVGSCHRHTVGRVLAGDNALSTLHLGPCPVAIASTGYAARGGAIMTVGVAYDGSSESKVAVAHAGLLAAELGASVTALNVVAAVVPTAGWGLAAGFAVDTKSQLAAARKRLGELDGMKLEFVLGAVCEELAAFSDHVDLIVCGSRRHGPAARIVLGSTSDYLARHAGCPLLVTPVADVASVARWQERCAVAVT